MTCIIRIQNCLLIKMQDHSIPQGWDCLWKNMVFFHATNYSCLTLSHLDPHHMFITKGPIANDICHLAYTCTQTFTIMASLTTPLSPTSNIANINTMHIITNTNPTPSQLHEDAILTQHFTHLTIEAMESGIQSPRIIPIITNHGDLLCCYDNTE